MSVFEGIVYHSACLDPSNPERPTLEVDAVLREGDVDEGEPQPIRRRQGAHAVDLTQEQVVPREEDVPRDDDADRGDDREGADQDGPPQREAARGGESSCHAFDWI